MYVPTGSPSRLERVEAWLLTTQDLIDELRLNGGLVILCEASSDLRGISRRIRSIANSAGIKTTILERHDPPRLLVRVRDEIASRS